MCIRDSLYLGWFFTRLLQPVFLYFYVLGHELTHVIFVYLCLGRVSGFRVGLDGGHIVTNKSNILIALSLPTSFPSGPLSRFSS